LTDTGTFSAAGTSNAYNISLLGASNSVTGATTLSNTGVDTIGTASSNSNTFTGGITASAASALNTAGNISAAGTGVINFNTPVNVTDTAVVGGVSTGRITFGATTIADTKTLTVGTGAATPITLSTVDGASNNSSNLTINTTGIVSANGAIGATHSLNTVTLTNSNSTTFSGAVNSGVITLTNTANNITFNGLVTANTLNTAAQGYDVFLNAGSNIVNAVTFANSGGVSLIGTNSFNGGVTSTISTTTVNGNVNTDAGTLNLGAVTLSGNSTFDTTKASAFTAGNALTLGTISANTFNTILNGGSNGAVNIAGLNNGGDLTLVNSHGATFANAVNAGNVNLTDTSGIIAFNGALTATTLNTTGAGYNAELNAGGTITNATTFSNLGGVSLVGTTLFKAGVSSTVSTTIVNGNVNTNAGAITLGAVTLSGNSSFDTTNGGSYLAGKNLTTNYIAGNTFDTVLNGGTAGVVSIAGINNGGNLTLTNSNGTTFSGAVSAGAININDTQANQTVAFQGNLTASSLTAAATSNNYNVSLTGSNNSISGATTLNNTGIDTIGTTSTNSNSFAGGINASAASLLNIAGTISAAGTGIINFNAPVSVTDDTIIGGTSVGQITLGSTTIANSKTLTVGTGSATPIVLDSINGTSTISSNLILNSSGATTINGAIGTINALNSLSSTGAGSVTFNSSVGSNTQRLGSVSINGASNLNGGSVYTSGTQTYTGAMTLGSFNRLDTSGSNITISNTIDGAYGLRLTTGGTSGTIALNGAVGTTTALTSLNATGLNINAVNVTTTGAQNYTGITTLNGNYTTTAGGVFGVTGATYLNGATTIDTTNGGLFSNGANVSFSNTINNAQTLAITGGSMGIITFNGDIGTSTALTSLNVNASVVTFNGAVGNNSNRLGSIAITGTTNLNGGSIYTSGSQTYNSAILMNTDNTLDAGMGAITFNSTLDSNTLARNLTINSSGATTFNGIVGGSLALSSITTDAAGTTVINGGSINTSGTGQIFNDAVTLGADATLNAGNGSITFAQTVDSASSSARNLTLNSTGTTTFNGTVGNSNALASVTTNAGGTTAINGGRISTTGSTGQVFNDVVTLGADTTLNASSGPITFAQSVDSASSTGRSLTLNSSGATTFNGTVGSNNALTSVTTDSAGTTAINGGSISTSGAGQSYNDIVTLGADTTLNAGSGSVTFAQSVDSASTASSLTINSSGATTFNGAVGNNNALASVTTDSAGNTAINGGSIKTSGVAGQSFNDNVTLGEDTLLTANNSGTITFGQTVNSAVSTTDNLTLSTAGASTFNGAVGTTNALNNLSSTGTGSVTFNGALGNNSQRLTTVNINGASNLNGGSIYTSGAQLYTGAVTIGSDYTLDAAIGTIGFSSTVNSAGTTPYSMILNTSGASTFTGAVGTINALNILNSMGTGSVTFNGAVGNNSKRLASVNITGASNLNGGSIYTSGDQFYNGAVTMNADNTLDAGAGNIKFNSTVDSLNSNTARNLTLNSSGTTTLNSSVGSNQALASITTDAAGTTVINGGTINTTGINGQVFHDVVTLGTDTVLNAGNGVITFGQTVGSNTSSVANNLTLNTSGASTFNGAVGTVNALKALSSVGTGSVTFNDTVGSNNLNLTSVAITGATNLNGGSVYTSGSQIYTGAVTLGANTLLDSAHSSVNLNSTVNLGAYNLTITEAMLSTIVGTITGSGSLIQNGSGTLVLDSSSTNYSGATIIDMGTLQLGIDNAFYNTASSINITSNGTFDLNGHNEILSALTGSGNVLLGSSTTNNLTVNNSISDEFDGVISGSGNIIKSGTGTLMLTAANSYTGNTSINSGVLAISNNTALGGDTVNNIYGAVTVAANAELDINNNITVNNNISLALDGNATSTTHAQLVATGNDTLNGVLTLGNSTTHTTARVSVLTNTDQLQANGVISGYDLDKIGAGLLALNNAGNNYTHNTVVEAGTVLVNTATSIPMTSDVIVQQPGATLEYAPNLVINIGSLSGNGYLDLNGTTLTTGSDGASTTFNGTITGTGNFLKTGGGILTLAGNNSFTGNTNVLGGTLNIASNSVLGNIMVNAGSTFEISGVNVNATQLTLNGGTGSNGLGSAFVTSGNASFTGAISIAADTNIISTGALVINGNIDSLANGGNKALAFQGNAAVRINGDIGDTNPLSTFTTSSLGTTTTNGAINTTGNQNFNNALTLAGDTTLNSAYGNVTFNNTVDGTYALAITATDTVTTTNFVAATNNNSGNSGSGNSSSGNSGSSSTPVTPTITVTQNPDGSTTTVTKNAAGTTTTTVGKGPNGVTTINSAVGGATPLTNLTINSNNIVLNNGHVTTSANQTYNGPVQINQDTTFKTGGNITLSSGITGTTYNLKMIGTSGNNTFTAMGNLSLASLTVTGSKLGNNTLAVETNDSEEWLISGANSGSIIGITELATSPVFTNIGNITGGNHGNIFALVGGSLTGNVTGGTGTNIIAATNNINNTFNITGYNSGNLTGIGGFSNIQNLDGGNMSNTFNFYDGSGISGIINGTTLNGTNTLDYSNYSSPINVIITGASSGGTLANSGLISVFLNITNVNSPSNGLGTLTVAGTGGQNTVHITGGGQGYVNDPIYFSGFSTISSSAANTKIVFDVAATFNIALNQAIIDGFAITFTGIPNFIADIAGQLSAELNALVISALSGATTFGNSNAGGMGGGSSAEADLENTLAITQAVDQSVDNINHSESMTDLLNMKSQKFQTCK
jgi:hypothetical protein